MKTRLTAAYPLFGNSIIGKLVSLFTLIGLFTLPPIVLASPAATQSTLTSVVAPLKLPTELPTFESNSVEQAIESDFQAFAKALYPIVEKDLELSEQLRFQLLLGRYQDVLATIKKLRHEGAEFSFGNPQQYKGFELYASSQLLPQNRSFQSRLSTVFEQHYSQLDNKGAHDASEFLSYSLVAGEGYLNSLHDRLNGLTFDFEKLDDNQRRQLAHFFVIYTDQMIYKRILTLCQRWIDVDRHKRYVIKRDVVIKTPDGAEVSAMVVRDRTLTQKRPAVLSATIYSDEETNLQRAIEAAIFGYVGVVSDTRGKRLSRSNITPYENEPGDVNAVINWISEQSWNDGRVVMYGGSYLGYTQWAATKQLHPALKTIVPSVAAIPGQGLPMENNIFLNANYAWTFLVTNGRMNDPGAYSTNNWHQVNYDWYQNGRPYREFDRVAGKPNPWLQKWLDHPAYDAYWQSMVPYKKDYAKINIPVLTLTGYYDDGQISALHYLKEHYRYNKNADHYLIIGPYDHFSSQILQSKTLRGYKLDPVALINMRDITFQWFDYVLNDGPKPELLKNKINYQLMGDNQWRHASSIDALNSRHQRFYLNTQKQGNYYQLSTEKQSIRHARTQSIDFKDRSKTYNNHYYPYPIVKDDLELEGDVAYVTQAFEQTMELTGNISGELHLKINKKDVDLGLVLFELKSDGTLHHLNYYIGRASYSKDMTKRQLLQPGKVEIVPFERARMISKKIEKGSRLLLLANVNLNPFAQVNYGSGKDVSDESFKDAEEPLEIQWMNSSFIDIPVSVYQAQ